MSKTFFKEGRKILQGGLRPWLRAWAVVNRFSE